VEAFLAIVLGSILIAETLARVGQRQTRLRAWREAAGTVGLAGVRVTNGLLEASLVGRVRGLRVVMQECNAGRHSAGTRLVVSGLGGGDLFLRSEDLRTALGKDLLGVEEIVTGAPEFDAQVYVQGTDPVVFAVLDAETRGHVARLLGGDLTVEGRPIPVRSCVAEGALRVEVPERGARGASLTDILRAVVSLAQRLVAPPDLGLRLARNLLRDPQPGFRLNTLVTLVREYPQHPATRRALLAARHDASAEVRLRAAMALGEKGRETLLALVATDATDDACAARAVAALGEHLPEPEAAKALRRAVDGNRAETAVACLEALGARGAFACEDAILAALRSPLDHVRTAAARALGHAGTVAAVRELRVAADSGPLEQRGAARQAIAAIQSRLPGASPGQLSLAEGEAGELSLAEAEAGTLSISGDEAGRLSLAESARERSSLAPRAKERA
jgi:HEAT repeat protein